MFTIYLPAINEDKDVQISVELLKYLCSKEYKIAREKFKKKRINC